MKSIHALFRVFLLVAVGGMTWGCVDHAYDFDRTDRSVTLIGETISIPLGNTGKMTLKDLLGDQMDDYLVSQSDGTLQLQYQGKPVSFVFDELKNIDGAAPFARFCDMPIGYDFSMFSKPANPAFDAKGEADLSGVIPAKIQLQNVSRSVSTRITNLPTELSDLKSIILTPESRVEITVSIPKCLFISGTVTPDLSIDMGSVFVSDAFPDGVIKINDQLDSQNGYSVTKSIPLHRFTIAPNSFNPADHSLNVNASVKFAGSCSISKPRTNRTLYEKAPQTVQLEVMAVMYDIACKDIEGSFDYTARKQVVFSLGDLAAGLSDQLTGDVFLDFDDPAILLDIQSNVTIPVTAKLNMAARKNRVSYAEVKNIPVVFPVAEPGSTASKRFRMSKSPVPNPGEDPIAVDFAPLLSRIPDDMLITANASTQKNKTAVLRIGEDYRITLSPQVIIPLFLGPRTKVEVRDTVSLSSGLGSVLMNNPLRVMGEITNGFPLELAFDLVMTDASGVPLTEPVQQVIPAGSTSQVSLALAGKSGADLQQLSSAVLAFSLNGIYDSRPIKTDDAIQANLHIEIPGGYHLSF